MLKAIAWLHGYIRTPPFTPEARIKVGGLLRRLQEGEPLSMPHSRPMPSIGHSSHELRVRDGATGWRIIYFVDADAIVILDVFAKKSSSTPNHVLSVCRMRLRAYLSRS